MSISQAKLCGQRGARCDTLELLLRDVFYALFFTLFVCGFFFFFEGRLQGWRTDTKGPEMSGTGVQDMKLTPLIFKIRIKIHDGRMY